MWYITKATSTGFYESESLDIDNGYPLGTSIEDYMNDKFVPLNKDQIAFMKKNQYATPEEVFNMHIIKTENPVEISIEEVKDNKIKEILKYDSSNNINEFFIGDIPAWLTVLERSAYRTSIECYRKVGRTIATFMINGNKLSLPIDNADYMLSMLQIYADDCAMVTADHVREISTMEYIEEIENYNFKLGYPDKLTFTI